MLDITGLFTGRSFSGSKTACDLNTPAGCGAAIGVTDWQSERVDSATGRNIDYVPPQPDADHEWNAETKRWQKRAGVLEREARRTDAQTRIDALERKQQRRIRELLASSDPQLKAIDDEISELRRSVLN